MDAHLYKTKVESEGKYACVLDTFTPSLYGSQAISTRVLVSDEPPDPEIPAPKWLRFIVKSFIVLLLWAILHYTFPLFIFLVKFIFWHPIFCLRVALIAAIAAVILPAIYISFSRLCVVCVKKHWAYLLTACILTVAYILFT
jgi:hypothetical protein